MKKAAIVYGAVAVFAVIFNIVYTVFGYGETSPFMQFMFAAPLIGGAIPAIILAATRRDGAVSRAAFNLWNSGIATVTVGCLVRGIINISGRFTDFDVYYWIAGGALIAAAIAVQLAAKKGNTRRPAGAPGAYSGTKTY